MSTMPRNSRSIMFFEYNPVTRRISGAVFNRGRSEKITTLPIRAVRCIFFDDFQNITSMSVKLIDESVWTLKDPLKRESYDLIKDRILYRS